MWQYYIECSGANQFYDTIRLNENIKYHTEDMYRIALYFSISNLLYTYAESIWLFETQQSRKLSWNFLTHLTTVNYNSIRKARISIKVIVIYFEIHMESSIQCERKRAKFLKHTKCGTETNCCTLRNYTLKSIWLV